MSITTFNVHGLPINRYITNVVPIRTGLKVILNYEITVYDIKTKLRVRCKHTKSQHKNKAICMGYLKLNKDFNVGKR